MGISDSDLIALVEQLGGDDHNAAEDAEWELEQHGSRPLDLLIARAPSFGRFGKLCAIELFEHIGDPRASAVLIPMLRDEDETVREWAAGTLASLCVPEAAEAVVAAYEALKSRGDRLDWSEASGLRWALTQMGLRHPVLPPVVAERARQVHPLGEAWHASDLVDVIEELSSAQQFITHVAVHTRNAGTYSWRVDTDVEWPDLDVGLAWPELVASAREAALDVATHPPVPRDAYGTVSWVDRSDT